jgi:methanogenic corrinoid protein MtbC1
MSTLHQLAGQAIREQRESLAEAIVTRQYSHQGRLWEPFKRPGQAKSLRDAGYHLSYLAEAVAVSDASLFLDYVAWVRVLFEGLGFPPEALQSTLECTSDALRRSLPPDLAGPGCEFVDEALRSLPAMPTVLPSFVSPAAPFGPLAAEYLGILLRGDRAAAGHSIMSAVDSGTPVRDVYLHVFQPTQREIGRLWQTNQISVAQEHFCTAVTQMVMSQLYPRIFSTEKNGRRLVAACVGGELHEIGLRMVADFLELEGWDTYYLGANMPPGSVVQVIADRAADILAISTTMTFHLGQVAELISAVRASPDAGAARILVGGYPFNVAGGLWRQMGADGYAASAEDALAVADGWAAGGALR